MTRLDEMLALAVAARRNAHAPYSGFRVGACVRAEDGRLFAGCNVENAAYPLTQCAEAGALAAMVAAGGRRIVEVVVVAEGERLCTPCGACRQKLAELAAADTPIHVAAPSGVRASFTLGALLPHAFALDPGTP
jgi:cytidine deaminase